MKFDQSTKSRKSASKLVLWAGAGLAYFNLFSSLDVGPGLQLGLSGVVPMAALIVYFLRQQPIDHRRSVNPLPTENFPHPAQNHDALEWDD
jgi:hypothetical protein